MIPMTLQLHNIRHSFTSRAAFRWLLALLLVLSCQTGLLLIGGYGATAQAQEEEDKNAPMKGRETQALSKRVYDLITEANELVDAERSTEALKVLDRIKAFSNLTPYETAQLYSFYGFLYFNNERYQEALRAYGTVLAQPDLPDGLKQQTIRTMSQLAFVTEDYNAAIKYAQQYIDEVGPDPELYVVIGTAYYQLEQMANIIPPVEKAISLARERDMTVKEQWWLLLRVAYWEQENYAKVREILETLVINWPKKEYWTQLSGIYFELNDEAKQLAAYEAAYDQGLLQSSSELVQMAQLFMAANVPYKGAKVLEKGFEEGKVERNVRNLRLLSQAWQLAQEDRKAIPALVEAAGISDDGELYARLATSYLNLSQYGDCIEASNSALDKGSLKDTGNTWLVLGMCQFERKAYTSAKNAFRNAAKYDRSAKNARSWISYVESEEERLQQLERSLKQAERQAQAANQS